MGRDERNREARPGARRPRKSSYRGVFPMHFSLPRKEFSLLCEQCGITFSRRKYEEEWILKNAWARAEDRGRRARKCYCVRCTAALSLVANLDVSIVPASECNGTAELSCGWPCGARPPSDNWMLCSGRDSRFPTHPHVVPHLRSSHRGNHNQSRYVRIILGVVSQSWQCVQYRCGRDPGVAAFDGPTTPSSIGADFGPLPRQRYIRR